MYLAIMVFVAARLGVYKSLLRLQNNLNVAEKLMIKQLTMYADKVSGETNDKTIDNVCR